MLVSRLMTSYGYKICGECLCPDGTGLFFPCLPLLPWRPFYLLSTPNIYTRTAAILVKDDSKSGSSTNAMSEFSDLGIFKSNTNINNELLTLKSPTLMTEVVQRLGLNETYTIRKGLRTIGLYKCNPIAVTYRHLDEIPISFTINLPSKKRIYYIRCND